MDARQRMYLVGTGVDVNQHPNVLRQNLEDYRMYSCVNRTARELYEAHCGGTDHDRMLWVRIYRQAAWWLQEACDLPCVRKVARHQGQATAGNPGGKI